MDLSIFDKINAHGRDFSFINNNVQHIILWIEKWTKSARLSDDTISFLTQELSSNNLEKIAYCHYPITEEQWNIYYEHINRRAPERSFLEDSKQIREILSEHNVKPFISGHTHFEYRSKIDEIIHITIPSFSETQNWEPALGYWILDTDTMKIEIKAL